MRPRPDAYASCAGWVGHLGSTKREFRLVKNHSSGAARVPCEAGPQAVRPRLTSILGMRTIFTADFASRGAKPRFRGGRAAFAVGIVHVGAIARLCDSKTRHGNRVSGRLY